MGSVIKDANGRKRLSYFNADGKRKTLYLGRVSQKDAQRIDTYVEKLVTAQVASQPIDTETARWVAKLGEPLAKKLAHQGLIAPRSAATLCQFVDAYIASRSDLKPLTLVKFNATKDYLVAFFGAERPLREITPGDADDWRIHVAGKKLSENTVRKHCQIAKQFFTAAVRKKLIDSSPFDDLKSTTLANPDRFYFVTTREAETVLAACPDSRWRLIFALSRYGGLRCPSEHLALKWDDIDWDNGRMVVHSPKTEHHPGRSSRVVPLFPELNPLLLDEYLQADPDDPYVIRGPRDGRVNWRTGLERIIRNAGLKPWPKLFQNLRSTRETELAREYPMHVVCAWIGNSKAVAAKHYLQVTDDDFQKAAQNPAQSGTDSTGCNGPEDSESAESDPFSAVDTSGPLLPASEVAEAGLEPARPSRDTGF